MTIYPSRAVAQELPRAIPLSMDVGNASGRFAETAGCWPETGGDLHDGLSELRPMRQPCRAQKKPCGKAGASRDEAPLREPGMIPTRAAKAEKLEASNRTADFRHFQRPTRTTITLGGLKTAVLVAERNSALNPTRKNISGHALVAIPRPGTGEGHGASVLIIGARPHNMVGSSYFKTRRKVHASKTTSASMSPTADGAGVAYLNHIKRRSQ